MPKMVKAPESITELDDLWLFCAEVFDWQARAQTESFHFKLPKRVLRQMPKEDADYIKYEAEELGSDGVCDVIRILEDTRIITSELRREAKKQMRDLCGRKRGFWWGTAYGDKTYTGHRERSDACLLFRAISLNPAES
jgi:hypothetical protein